MTYQPQHKILWEVQNKLNNFVLADPIFAISAPIDFLIAIDLFPLIFCSGDRQILVPDIPTIYKTKLGYIIMSLAPVVNPYLSHSLITLVSVHGSTL